MSSALNFIIDLARRGLTIPSKQVLERRGLNAKEIAIVHEQIEAVNLRLTARARDVLRQIPSAEGKTFDRVDEEGIEGIFITFPLPLKMPPGFDRVLVDLIEMMCEAYEAEHPTRVCWPAGIGALPRWQEPEEPTFDSSIFSIQVSERRADDKELIRRGIDPTTIPEDI